MGRPKTRIKKICKTCGEEFEVFPSLIKIGQGKFCSQKCYSRKGKNNPNYGKHPFSSISVCNVCGKRFRVKNSRIKVGSGTYCSNKCRGIGMKESYTAEKRIKMRKQMKGNGNPHWKGGLIKRICKICGKEFFVMPCILKRVNGGKFCSRECFRKWNSGRNNPLWKEKIKRICKVCGKEFKVNSSVVKNGGGIFCSHSCGSIFQNKHSNRKFTSIELKIEKYLKKLNISYQAQKVIKEGKTIADFYIPAQRIVIYCDGTYWHSSAKVQRRDATQNLLLTMSGYKVFRFWEKDINKSAKRCVNKVVRFLKKKESYEKGK